MLDKLPLAIKKNIKKKSVFYWEAVFIVIISLVIFTFSVEYDMFERLHELSRDHEDWEIDEVFSLIMISSVALIFILVRNAKYLKLENTRRIEAENKIKKMAFYDGLTDLPNRDLFLDRLNNVVVDASRNNTIAAVLFVDLDNFKQVNDSFGHHVGDRLLINISKRLTSCLRTGDTLARIAGDEFIVVAKAPINEDWIWALAERMIASMQDAFLIDEKEIHASVSVGVALYPGDGESAERLIKNADAAMYHAKREGKNRFQFFSAEIDQSAKKKSVIRGYLHQAISSNEFSLKYQPIIDLENHKVIGAEALLRWNNKALGEVSPVDFIPVAEETGLIVSIGHWVLREACLQLKKWQDAGLNDITLSINMSARQLNADQFVDDVNSALKETGVPAQFLELELTESMIMSDAEKSVDALIALSDIGVSIAVDDFGTGYSSIGYLKRFKLDRLKIDKSFVNNTPHSKEDVAISNAIISLAKSLNLKITAEGIENKEQLNYLKEKGCDAGQGFLFEAPLNVEEFEGFLCKSRTS